jgi:hypothetical protein
MNWSSTLDEILGYLELGWIMRKPLKWLKELWLLLTHDLNGGLQTKNRCLA